jgi:alpha-beta hydrolase superfamily lysophospholipase
VNRVNAPDGTPLAFDMYEPVPPVGRTMAAVLFLHDWHPRVDGLEGKWAGAGAALRDGGFAVYFLDQRGHGRSGGPRGHLSRFSQLLGDLHAFRRAVRRRADVPQILVGDGFGGLVVLRYLETQPGESPVAAVVMNPWLALRRQPAVWKRLAATLADLWPTFPTGRGDGYMTAGARAELRWARRAVVDDCARIERPLLFMLGGADPVSDAGAARDFATKLAPPARVCWYAEQGSELLQGPRAMADLRAFLSEHHS